VSRSPPIARGVGLSDIRYAAGSATFAQWRPVLGPLVWEVTTPPNASVHLIDTRGTRDLHTGQKLRATAALGHLFFPNGVTPTTLTDATVFHQYSFGQWG